MVNIVFVIALAIIALIDWKKRTIYNWMVLPVIAYGCYNTGVTNCLWAIVTFLCLAPFYHDPDLNPNPYGAWRIGGGDIKLFSMVAAFIGWKVIPVVVGTYLILKVYRAAVYRFYEPIPVGPFIFAASICFLW